VFWELESDAHDSPYLATAQPHELAGLVLTRCMATIASTMWALVGFVSPFPGICRANLITATAQCPGGGDWMARLLVPGQPRQAGGRWQGRPSRPCCRSW